jgi:hypothetical protein
MENIKVVLSKVFLVLMLLLSSGSFAGEAKDAWQKITGKKQSERPEFTYIVNDPNLANVLLYGDSISIGYTQAVRGKLQKETNVYRLYRNGGDSGSFINKMILMHNTMQNEKLTQAWDFKWDVIHFNVGLHDLKYVLNGKLDKENGRQVSTLSDYKNNLHAIVAYLQKLAPSAQLIFATTTPVPEGAKGRFTGDAKKYNQVALEVMEQYPSIIVNDLYNLSKPNQTQWWVEPSDVHYNEIGKNAQGAQVAKTISTALATRKIDN